MKFGFAPFALWARKRQVVYPKNPYLPPPSSLKSSRSHRTLSEAGYRLTGHLGNTTVLFRDADEDGQIAAEGSGPGAGEVMQRLWYYPFGLQLQGIGRDEPAPAHLYRNNGKSWDPASGLSDYGARWYDAGSGRWSGVDPLAAEYAGWSPYNYVMGNPIINIDPDGRSVENTMFLDSDGNELGRTEDNLPDAVVVVSDGEINDFHQAYMGAALSPGYIGDDDVVNLRGYGDSYMVDGINDVWNASMAVTLPPGSGGFVDSKGRPLTDIHPEAGSYSAILNLINYPCAPNDFVPFTDEKKKTRGLGAWEF